jgi:prevent-host-death family protein
MKTVAASVFKTHCLSMLDEVAGRGEVLLIVKRGKPVARVVPIVSVETSPQATLLGTMLASDDLIQPPLPHQVWDAAVGR